MGSSKKSFLPLFICAFILTVHLASSSSSSSSSSSFDFGGAVPFISTDDSECRGSIAECMAMEEEFALDSESSRRILAARRYISYGALRRNTVPCSRRGASYYNCRRGAQANPYSRGCSRITRCRH